jgi:hypothetical protein
MHGGRIWVVSNAGQKIDVSDGTPHARRIPGAGSMTKRIA